MFRAETQDFVDSVGVNTQGEVFYWHIMLWNKHEDPSGDLFFLFLNPPSQVGHDTLTPPQPSLSLSRTPKAVFSLKVIDLKKQTMLACAMLPRHSSISRWTERWLNTISFPIINMNCSWQITKCYIDITIWHHTQFLQPHLLTRQHGWIL